MLNMEECNNNNYVPSYYPVGAAPVMSSSTSTFSQGYSSSMGIRNCQTSFTFTSPTQCYTSGTPRPSIQTTSHISQMAAPGVGAAWQHSIPTTMPWVPGSGQLPQMGLGNASQFSGFISNNPVVKRPKRKALDDSKDAPCSKVYLTLDKFKNLHISPKKKGHDQPEEADCSKNSSWQHFNEVEQRLEEELEDEAPASVGGPLGGGAGGAPGVIRVAEGLLEVDTGQPLLPREVLREVQKPNMQLVLWQAPGASIRDILGQQDSRGSPPSPPSPTPPTPTSVSNSPSLNSSSSRNNPPARGFSPQQDMNMNLGPPVQASPLNVGLPGPSRSDCVLPGGMCCWDGSSPQPAPSLTHPSAHTHPHLFNSNSPGLTVLNNNISSSSVFSYNNNSSRISNNSSSDNGMSDLFSLDDDTDMQL